MVISEKQRNMLAQSYSVHSMFLWSDNAAESNCAELLQNLSSAAFLLTVFRDLHLPSAFLPPAAQVKGWQCVTDLLTDGFSCFLKHLPKPTRFNSMIKGRLMIHFPSQNPWDLSSGTCFHEMVWPELTFCLLEHENFSPLLPSTPSSTTLPSVALPHVWAKLPARKALFFCVSVLLF